MARVVRRRVASHATGLARIFAGVFVLLIAFCSPGMRANADPNLGEGRPITRDPDRVYTVVAGEADGAATVTNPANLGFLRGANGILDVAYMARSARRRGSGVGAFVGVPLPWRILALGLGYQFIDPRQPDSGDDNAGLALADEPYSKISFALAVPLERWIPGLSLGLSYSRLAASKNWYADDLNQVDLGISYWLNRFFGLGLVGRALNQPEFGLTPGRTREPLVLDPEVAIRPFGNAILELAGGVRAYPGGSPDEPRFRTGLGKSQVEPRGRVLINAGGVRFFAEVEGYSDAPEDIVAFRTAVRMQAGLEFNFSHFSFGGGPAAIANEDDAVGLKGGVARARVSHERYPAIVVSRPRQVTRIKLSKYSGESGMWRVIEEIDGLAGHAGVILVETRGASFGYAQLEEVREAILRARDRGSQVVVYMEGGGLPPYFLAASASRIVVHPQNTLNILGMTSRTIYYAELLKKLGARGDFIAIAEYKSRPEIVERSGPSPAAAQQRRKLHADVWNHVLRTIALDRGRDPLEVKTWIDEAPMQPDRALELGLVDAMALPDELDEELERWLGKPVRIAEARRTPSHADTIAKPAHVAVLFIEGSIVNGESLSISLLGYKVATAGAATLSKVIEGLRKDHAVKAVVVRLNTPGGMASAGRTITRQLDLLRREKPVVISMGPTCASAGYYIATAGQYVLADATTVTGSIGIYYPKMDLSGTAKMFGLGIDEQGFGRRSLMTSWWKPYDDEEHAAAYQNLRVFYDDFIDRVAAARSLSPEIVDTQLARGRVWSGIRAIENGLVDEYGGLREAIARARLIAGMEPWTGKVHFYHDGAGFLTQIRRLFGLRIMAESADILPTSFEDRPWSTPLLRGTASVGAALPAILTQVLRQLPAALWLMEQPEPLALEVQPVVVE